MRPLDSREWLEAQRLIALAAGDHASFDHATALLDTLADLADAIRVETEQATGLRETIRLSLVEAGLIERTDQPDYPTLESLVRMVLP